MTHQVTRPLLAAFFLGAFAGVAGADGHAWNCSNLDFEISCDSKGCTQTAPHTPMDIQVSADMLTVCAYTGCWSGAPTATVWAGGLLTVTGTGLTSQSGQGEMSASVSIDTGDGVATVLVAGLFATPAICTPG